MYMRYFINAIIAIAVVVGAISLFISRENMFGVMIVQQFFQIALPVLAFGALVKYLLTNR